MSWQQVVKHLLLCFRLLVLEIELRWPSPTVSLGWLALRGHIEEPNDTEPFFACPCCISWLEEGIEGMTMSNAKGADLFLLNDWLLFMLLHGLQGCQAFSLTWWSSIATVCHQEEALLPLNSLTKETPCIIADMTPILPRHRSVDF